MSRRATTMNIYIYDRTWSKYSKAFSESKSESDLNFSCLQKLKAKKKGKKKKKILHGLYAGICLAISEFQKLINKNKYLTMKYLTSSI